MAKKTKLDWAEWDRNFIEMGKRSGLHVWKCKKSGKWLSRLIRENRK